MLFEKAEIKKKNREKLTQKSESLKNDFISNSIQELNTNLSSTLLNSKQLILEIKNRLIDECIEELKNELNKRIKKNQSEYYTFILNLIKQIYYNNNILKKKSILYFNNVDFKHFNQNKEELDTISGKNIKIEQSDIISIGGFLITQDKGDVMFNYDFSNMIRENLSFIEIQFTQLISDFGIKKLQIEFESFITTKKKEIKDYLIKYDKI
ncbi:MAG: hypothetical protein KGD57_01930 [Candidatus Lokiarchaeota archaeon]|nr:hypothetical protein [Candidatus Lokiarchaeota archaeon]